MNTIFRLVLVAAVALGGSACKPKIVTTEPDPAVASEDDAGAEEKKPEAKPDKVAEAPGKKYPPPPANAEPRPFDFPDVESFTLDNGLTVYVVGNHEVPTVTVHLMIRAGAMDDQHLAPFTATMLGEGTTTRSKAKLDEAIEFVGGTMGAGAGMHASSAWAHVLTRDLKLALVLLADEVTAPAFPAAALDKIKGQAKTSLGFAKSDPQTLASVLFSHVAYPEGHPYGRKLATPAEIDAVTVQGVRAFHDTFYRPNNSYLLLVGDVTPKSARDLVERSFGKWARSDTAKLPGNPLNKFTEYRLPEKVTVNVIDMKGASDSTIVVGNLALARGHEDWVPLAVANTILGDDATGRLFSDLREEQGLTYGVYSSVGEAQAPGTFEIGTRTATETTGRMLTGIFEHIARMRADPPSEEEFRQALDKLAGSFPLEVETADDIAAKVADSLVYGLPLDYWRAYWSQFAKVERESIRPVARRYMHAVPHVVVVGDLDAIRGQIEKALPDAELVVWTLELERARP